MVEKVTLYSTGCPKCMILKKKLEDKNIPFEVVENRADILNKGIVKVPILEIDGVIYEFVKANTWVNEREKNGY